MKNDLVKLRHARSQKDFPEIALEENEYVELAIRRSPVGVILIWAGEALAAIFFACILILFQLSPSVTAGTLNASGRSFLYLVLYIAFAAILISGLVGTHVYRGNRLYVTNKRLLQQSTNALFSKSTNVIDLVSIEDVSFQQSGVLEHVFKLGTLRMSTVGDETTYTFKYVDTPTDELEVISHLVHIEKVHRRSTKAADAPHH